MTVHVQEVTQSFTIMCIMSILIVCLVRVGVRVCSLQCGVFDGFGV